MPYQVLITLIVVVLVLLYALNRPIFDKWVKSHNVKSNRLLKMMLALLLLCLVALFITDNFCIPPPPEDQLVVAISPFYYIDESGQTGADINTANDFKERLEAEKGLGIKVIMLELDNLIRDKEDAKSQGKKVGAHLVIYGETKKKIGNIGAVKYYILPLPSLEIHEVVKGSPITEEVTFSMVTEEPIIIVESLREKASSAIYTIGALENYKKSEFSSVISFFKSIKDYENHSSILFYIGNCYLFSTNLNESLQYYDKAIAKDLQSAEAWSNKGVVLALMGRYVEATAAYDKAIEINPQFALVWYNKGVVLALMGRYEEALAACDKAIAINPQCVPAWNSKGSALAGLNWHEEALAAFDKAIKIYPQDAKAWNNKGIALDKLAKHEEAKEAFEKAHEIDPIIEIP